MYKVVLYFFNGDEQVFHGKYLEAMILELEGIYGETIESWTARWVNDP